MRAAHLEPKKITNSYDEITNDLPISFALGASAQPKICVF